MSDDRIRIIFNEAVDKPASARGAFLDEACGDDAALRAEIESLLAHHATEIVSPTEVPTKVRVASESSIWPSRPHPSNAVWR